MDVSATWRSDFTLSTLTARRIGQMFSRGMAIRSIPSVPDGICTVRSVGHVSGRHRDVHHGVFIDPSLPGCLGHGD